MEPEGLLSHSQVYHMSLSWARLIQPMSPHSIIILFAHLRLGPLSGPFPSGLPTKTPYAPLLSLIRTTCSSYLILVDLITRIMFGDEYRSLSSSLCSLLHSLVTSSALGPYVFLRDATPQLRILHFIYSVSATHWVFLNHNFSKEQCMLPEDDRMIETCRSFLSVLMWILDH